MGTPCFVSLGLKCVARKIYPLRSAHLFFYKNFEIDESKRVFLAHLVERLQRLDSGVLDECYNHAY